MKRKIASLAGLAAVGALVAPTPATAADQGTSDAVVTCEGAYEYDDEVYTGPGFVCEVEPDVVKVNGVEYTVVRYRLVIRKGNTDVVESEAFDYGMDPAPVFFSPGKLKAGTTYNVDYRALLDRGDWVEVRDDDFTIEVPKAVSKPKLRVKFGKLKAGAGKGYVLSWSKSKNAEGYVAQIKAKGGKWKSLALTGARAAEFGQIKKRPGKFSFRVAGWNAGGKGKAATRRS